MPSCNTTLEDETINGEKDLAIGLTFHHVGEICTAAFGITAILIAFYLIFQHANHYSRPLEQKHIIRVLFMIPVYAVVAFLSIHYYRHAIYFSVLGDCYEAIAIASFFTLMCNYIAPNLHDQKDFFRAQEPKNWSWFNPIRWVQRCTGGPDKGILRRPQSGLTWFNVIWLCVFQYCFVRVFCTIVSVLTQATGLYCEASISPAFAHVWITCIEALSVTIAMLGLIQFYIQLKDELSEHKPGVKLLCIKLVIFFSFWQTLVISLASSSAGPFQPTQYIYYPDIKVGIPSMLITIEMTLFAILHIFAFPWKRPYSLNTSKRSSTKINAATPYAEDPLHASGPGFSGMPKYYGGRFGWRAIMDAANPWDLVKASARGFKWLFVGRRHRHLDHSYTHRQTHAPPGTLGDATKLTALSTVNDNASSSEYDRAHDPTSYESARPQWPLAPSTSYHGTTPRGTDQDYTVYEPQRAQYAQPLHSGLGNGDLADAFDARARLNPDRYQSQDRSRSRSTERWASSDNGYEPEVEGDRAGLLHNAGMPTGIRKEIEVPHPGSDTHPAFRQDRNNGAGRSDAMGGSGWV